MAHAVRPFGIETRTVRVGESNDALVEITYGLREAEHVLLTDPGKTLTPGATSGAAAAGRVMGAGAFANALQPR